MQGRSVRLLFQSQGLFHRSLWEVQTSASLGSCKRYVTTPLALRGRYYSFQRSIKEFVGRDTDTVILISENGEKLGNSLVSSALKRARSLGADFKLTQVATLGKLPVCRIVAAHSVKPKKVETKATVKLKEVELGTSICANDFEMKVARVKGWLEKGLHVKVSVIYKNGGEDRESFLERFHERTKSFASFPQGLGRSATANQRRKPKGRTSVLLLVPKSSATKSPTFSNKSPSTSTSVQVTGSTAKVERFAKP